MKTQETSDRAPRRNVAPKKSRKPAPPAKSAPSAKVVPSAEPAPSAIGVFADPAEYLEAWFAALGPARAPQDTPSALATIAPAELLEPFAILASARTEVSVAAGVDLPFERFVKDHGIGDSERRILLALLRNALDPQSIGGLRTIDLLRMVGADTVGRHRGVVRLLEGTGRLRELGLLESLPAQIACDRHYRLPPRMVEPLASGQGDPEALPEVSADPLEALRTLMLEAARLRVAVESFPPDSLRFWAAPRIGAAGWDTSVVERRRLLDRLEASARTPASPIGQEILRLGLEGTERLVWAALLQDSEGPEVGFALPHLLRVAGPQEDPQAAAERLLGPFSKLGRADVLRFSRPSGPLLEQLVWMSSPARARVVPWRRGAFEIHPGTDLEAISRKGPLGFTASGRSAEDRAVAATAGCTGT